MKSVLILGATSDIAKAIAYKYANHGWNLILASRKHSRLTSIVNDISKKFKVNVRNIEFDALNFNSHEQFYNKLDPKPDIAISVFGYYGSNEFAKTDFKETEKIIQSNYTGAVSIFNIIANDFEEKKSGVLVGVSSAAGERAKKDNYFYASAKAGFNSYLSGLRNRLYSSNVHVLTVNLGYVKTSMLKEFKTPKCMTLTPERVADEIYNAVKKKKILYIYNIYGGC